MLATLIETLTRWCAPWQTFYGDSQVTEIAVTSVHVVAMLVGGGIAVAADRLTLRALRVGLIDRSGMLAELEATHRPVMIGLAALFLSGLALAASDVETFSASPAFLVKLSLVVLLSMNGLFLVRTETLLRREPTEGRWRRLRLASWLSLLLWVSTAVVGVVLVNAA
jgi:hypothetical protein